MTETMNDLIRAAARRPVDVAQPEPHVAPKVGDVGIGRGGSAAPRSKPVRSNEVVNARLRAGFRVVRSAALRDGLSVDLDNPWGH
jgi:hypothetical protein